ncbi:MULTISPECIES: LuxR C-terminal-related transcriptional regulator [Kitasatospora]|uniref:LuxR family transcriptional regulator n=1 Tax=Kitasatospora setae (strain ATCC 33774 / DSM 43861 / JCM 3304 / KCC A-0304 / NBRC 14216 / KM-6054) TaxID=452652 RepID=E4NJG3_KITSK|nr:MULTISPECIES: LuxR C-terminal-related transcriptional regulator [Kitasatospora]BAJ33111.1 LuxR family transcriptional regulator [Kitasatospora setae KM-6054]
MTPSATSTEAGPARRPRPDPAGGPDIRRLTALDVGILEGVAIGIPTVRLAAALHLSRQGVEYRIGLMMRRFQAVNRPALISRAHSLGVLSVGSWPPRVLPEFLEP